jgi:2,4-dichlorophenol 6-monooxygenase
LFEALGVLGGDEEGIAKALASAAEPTEEGKKKRAAIHQAIELKHYEFNAHGVEHNQRYASTAVVPDGTVEQVTHDEELFGRPCTRPGAKLVHAWLVSPDGHRVSTLDLVGHGSFAVVTGLSGSAWEEAAAAVAGELGLRLRTVVIDRDARDAYGEWHRRSEIEEDGVLLVRPDGYVAWRHASAAGDAAAASQLLGQALRSVLSRDS